MLRTELSVEKFGFDTAQNRLSIIWAQIPIYPEPRPDDSYENATGMSSSPAWMKSGSTRLLNFDLDRLATVFVAFRFPR